ncbi:MAG TPA: hypothetical protein DGX96_08110 [Lachnospiraceae bacterium]|nr:hypothetical protein [Lachnospiraceae bacterium]
MEQKQSRFLMDRKSLPVFLLIMEVCIAVLLVSGTTGCESMYYAAGPFYCLLFPVSIFLYGGLFIARQQIERRLKRRRFYNAIVFYRATVGLTLIPTLVLSLILGFNAQSISTTFFSQRYSYISILLLLPFLIFGSLLGPLLGLVSAMGLTSITFGILNFFGISTIVFGEIFSVLLRARGQKIALLLRNKSLSAVYGGAGAALGFSLAALLSFLAALAICLMIRKNLHDQLDPMALDHDEKLLPAALYYARLLLKEAVFFAILFVTMLVDVAIGGFDLTSLAGFYCVSLPLLLLCTILATVFFTRYPLLCQRDFSLGKRKPLRRRFSVMMELSGYVSIPASLFVFGAGKPIVQILHNGMNADIRNAAVLTVKLGAPAIAFGSFLILMMLLVIGTFAEKFILAAGAIAFVVQTLVLYAGLGAFHEKVEALGLSLVFFGAAFGIALYVSVRNSILRVTDTSFVLGLVRVLAAAITACLPVIALNDYMTDEVIPVGGTILLALIYWILFAVVSLWFRAPNLMHLKRVPGGTFVLWLADRMGL